MLEFAVKLRSVQDVQDFVALTTTRPFSITVRDEHNKISADSFMELFCLNFSHPLRVICDCDEAALEDLRQDKQNSPILLHHVDYVNRTRYSRPIRYGKEEPNQIVVDYIASMTDDYLIDLHRYLFPNSNYYVEYTGYFNDLYEQRDRLSGQLTLDQPI